MDRTKKERTENRIPNHLQDLEDGLDDKREKEDGRDSISLSVVYGEF